MIQVALWMKEQVNQMLEIRLYFSNLKTYQNDFPIKGAASTGMSFLQAVEFKIWNYYLLNRQKKRERECCVSSFILAQGALRRNFVNSKGGSVFYYGNEKWRRTWLK